MRCKPLVCALMLPKSIMNGDVWAALNCSLGALSAVASRRDVSAIKNIVAISNFVLRKIAI